MTNRKWSVGQKQSRGTEKQAKKDENSSGIRGAAMFPGTRTYATLFALLLLLLSTGAKALVGISKERNSTVEIFMVISSSSKESKTPIDWYPIVRVESVRKNSHSNLRVFRDSQNFKNHSHFLLWERRNKTTKSSLYNSCILGPEKVPACCLTHWNYLKSRS